MRLRKGFGLYVLPQQKTHSWATSPLGPSPHIMKRPSLIPAVAFFGLSLIASAHLTEEEKIVASDGTAGDLFGSSVSVDDSIMVVGAPGAGGRGAAYIFVHDGLNWVEEAKLMPDDGQAGDDFGHAVTVHGNEVVIGAPGNDAVGVDAGAAYVYREVAGVWSLGAKLLGSGAGDEFGASVGLEHGHIAVGAPREAAGLAGSVYLFEAADLSNSPYTINVTTIAWTQIAELSASDPMPGDEFGYSLKMGDETLLVGSPHSNGLALNAGAAYIFDEVGGVWSQTAKLQSNSGAAGDHFGISVARSGDLLSIGALGDDTNGANAGARYNFVPGVLGGWLEGDKKLGKRAGDQFGGSVSSANQFVVVGQAKHDGVSSNTGDARLFVGKTLIQVFVASDAATDDNLGCAVASSTCWIAIGACGSDTNGADAGAVYAYVTVHGFATMENGSGVNPVILASEDEPNIGQEWEIAIDATAYPTTMFSVLYVYGGLGNFRPTSFGQILVDTTTPLLLARMAAGGGLLHHHIDVPSDPSLIGFDAGVQGLLYSASGPLTLTNAESVRVGCSAGGGHHAN